MILKYILLLRCQKTYKTKGVLKDPLRKESEDNKMNKKDLEKVLECVEYAREQHDSSCIEVIDGATLKTYDKLIEVIKKELED